MKNIINIIMSASASHAPRVFEKEIWGEMRGELCWDDGELKKHPWLQNNQLTV